MKVAVPLVAGLVVFALLGEEGFILGIVVAYLLWAQSQARERIEALEARVEKLARVALRLEPAAPRAEASPAAAPAERTAAEAPVFEVPVAEAPVFEVPVAEVPLTPRPPDVEAIPVREPAPEPAAPLPETPAARRPAADRPAARPARREEEAVNALVAQVRAFLFGGNTLVRVGVVVLFFGFTFLVKYAVDNALFPVELRLAAAAAGAVALTGVGWRLRERRPDFALALQGGGTAVLYLTIFATFRLYALLPAPAAFGLLVATTGLCAALALLQNAQGLAVLALLGGFFAPVLASTGEGSHVALFSYYALLNGAILVLAWFRAWRPLNLVGFFCTFGIAGLWVADRYEPALFATTEPFLVLFFGCYFVLSLLHARHRAPDVRAVVDGTLVFGLPVVVFSLQAVLVAPFAYGLAWSAFAFGVFYAAAAYVLYRRHPALLAVLVESFAGIGLVLGTMVLPFALDATWTGTGWALEGAALVWLGFRQRRWLLRLSGAVLQGAAGVSFIEGLGAPEPGLLPVLNAFVFGGLALSLSALVTARLVHRHRDGLKAWEPPFQPLFLAVGLAWWLAAGAGELGRLFSGRLAFHLFVVHVALTALACVVVGPRLAWPALRVPSLLGLPAMALLLALDGLFVDHPFQVAGFVAWPLGVAVHVYALRRGEAGVRVPLAELLHAGGLWFAAVLLGWEAVWAAETLSPAGAVWPVLAYGLVPLLLALAVTRLAAGPGWPFGVWRMAYLIQGGAPLLAFAWCWSGYATLFSDGDPAPLPYLPVVNPLDLVLGLGVVAGVVWYRASRPMLPFQVRRTLPQVLVWGLAASAFVWLNATLARTVHAWGGVRYDLFALLGSAVFQTALTIFWTALSVTTMAVAARRGGRTPWIAAATLLGVTVVKLFVVDLSNISTVARIVTFIVVGLLVVVVGYLAPVPPQRPPVETPDEPVKAPA